MTEKQYIGRDVAAVVPTFRRPHKLRNLLESLAGQTESCGRVIVVDGDDGEKTARAVVEEFASRLDVDYQLCLPPGQIRQRNAGLARLREDDRLVAFLDDDLVLEPETLENVVAFWNRSNSETGGVGLNIVNALTPKGSFLPGLLSKPRPGSVLKSGLCVPWLNLATDIRTQWLGGGYTVWKREVLDEFKQTDLKTAWAVGEDLRYSFPIGKKYHLYACASARVRHEHVYDQAPSRTVHRYQGRMSTLAQMYFVEHYPEFSRWACADKLLRSSLSRLTLGLITGNRPMWQLGLGRAEGLWTGLALWLKGADLGKALEDG